MQIKSLSSIHFLCTKASPLLIDFAAAVVVVVGEKEHHYIS